MVNLPSRIIYVRAIERHVNINRYKCVCTKIFRKQNNQNIVTRFRFYRQPNYIDCNCIQDFPDICKLFK